MNRTQIKEDKLREEEQSLYEKYIAKKKEREDYLEKQNTKIKEKVASSIIAVFGREYFVGKSQKAVDSLFRDIAVIPDVKKRMEDEINRKKSAVDEEEPDEDDDADSDEYSEQEVFEQEQEEAFEQ